MTITFLGIGRVGGALAGHFAGGGHTIILAKTDRPSASLDEALRRNPDWLALPAQEAVERSQAVLLAVPFGSTAPLLQSLRFNGQVLIDATNPVGPGLSHGLDGRTSGAQTVQMSAPGARVVKAFNIYGAENLETPPGASKSLQPMMPLAGDDSEARTLTAELVRLTGYEPLDVGPLDRALHLEHLALLWIKMVRAGGRSPHLAWAAVEGR